MPYYKQNNTKELGNLVHQLADELKSEPSLLTEDGPKITSDAPTIIEEKGMLNLLHVTVIWDAFRDLSGEQRGQVIMQAYEKAKGPTIRTQIGLAMGLTREQRTRILAAT